jgi:hypothetical protein
VEAVGREPDSRWAGVECAAARDRSRWSGPRCVERDPQADGHSVAAGGTLDGIQMMSRSLRSLNSSETTADVAQRDENSHAMIRNVHGDSSAVSRPSCRRMLAQEQCGGEMSEAHGNERILMFRKAMGNCWYWSLRCPSENLASRISTAVSPFSSTTRWSPSAVI